ncbi:MAG: alpha/beta hydrolase [Opitutaceae bacterium]|nr:alpha/beta hydrolase [Opitutaceae bacterium]
MPSLSHQHLFQPGTISAAPPLLLLHGTGGSERDLLPLARQISPGSAVLSPRGEVNENGALRFFARLAEGVFDPTEVTRRTHALADFIAAAAKVYCFDSPHLIAIGFSNGANIAATLLQLRPASLGGAALLRPMVVLDQPASPGSLAGKPVLIANGTLDPIVPASQPPHLAALLRAGGADVTLESHPASHGLTPADIAGMKRWFAPRLSRGPV